VRRRRPPALFKKTDPDPIAALKMAVGEAPTCASNWRLCATNADIINIYLPASDHAPHKNVPSECTRAADQLARFGTPTWAHWDINNFPLYQSGDDATKSGIITLRDKEVMFENGSAASRTSP
jgi:hypothetical protein